MKKLISCCAVLSALSGCAFGGATVEHKYHLVEPGGTVECVDGKVKVRDPGTNEVGDYDPVGKVILPKSVYRELREAWIKLHPETSQTPEKKP